MNKILIALAIGAIALSTGAIAQMRGGMMQDMTRAQAQQRADMMFQRFDTNHDGTITRQEAEQAAAQYGERGQRMVDRIFRDTQSITLQQFEAQQLAQFDRDDLNHDGVVTVAERQQVRAQLKAQRAGQAPAPAAPQGSPERG
ncbi:MAG TPA: EF-hand domain-containing protein [Sphingomicrobium sp.]|nr:EF-hand domain-containing protein [Sphingomicrobium sp.]